MHLQPTAASQVPHPFASMTVCSSCGAASACACPHCGAPLCPTHVVEPDRLCQSCASALFSTGGRAGKRLIVFGGLVVLLAALAFIATILVDSHVLEPHGGVRY